MSPVGAGAPARRVFRLCVTNQPGVLARVALVFARLGLNIDRLVVSEAAQPGCSRMAVTASGEEPSLRLALGQLRRLVDVVHAEERTGKERTRAGGTPAGIFAARTGPTSC